MNLGNVWHQNLGSFSCHPVTLCLTALIITNETRSHDILDDQSTADGIVLYKFNRITGIDEELASSFKPTVADSVLENQLGELECDIKT
jgi:hypothetical protein